VVEGQDFLYRRAATW